MLQAWEGSRRSLRHECRGKPTKIRLEGRGSSPATSKKTQGIGRLSLTQELPIGKAKKEPHPVCLRLALSPYPCGRSPCCRNQAAQDPLLSCGCSDVKRRMEASEAATVSLGSSLCGAYHSHQACATRFFCSNRSVGQQLSLPLQVSHCFSSPNVPFCPPLCYLGFF